ncbi:uncharacterized protein LOC116847532 [Odontomachus brunneus]|uniref:uncharacterized protein LOC116847532 n=1 Tax=Odontomachus brunneus TaxID=486640 RepID=UPI0013F1C033|nr:uncharacterized protein LOC116847532 [Odontomachus brunneus]
MNIKYDECYADEWVITNTSVKWDGENKTITAVAIKNNLSNKVYCIYIEITGCKDNTQRRNEPTIMVNNHDGKCQMATTENEIYNVTKKVAKLEKDYEWLTKSSESLLTEKELYKNKRCF